MLSRSLNLGLTTIAIRTSKPYHCYGDTYAEENPHGIDDHKVPYLHLAPVCNNTQADNQSADEYTYDYT